MTDAGLKETVFHDWHVAHGGKMVEFGGWHMPVQYSSIVEEHQAVRQAAGLFDIAHMGRLWFTGPDAERFLDQMTTCNVPRLKEGTIRYSLVTNDAGGILDDVLIYRLPNAFLVVVNASNREKIVRWFETHRASFDFQLEDRTLSHAMLAVQGPAAVKVLAQLGCGSVAALRYYSSARTSVAGIDVLASRTGYTGEDGFELITENQNAQQLWDAVIEAGAQHGLRACGLGCRDTLRLEAAMPLYGHELNEEIDPLTAGLGFAVKLDAGRFVGREALLKIAAAGTQKTRIGLELQGKRIAREECAVFIGDRAIGRVTSGTFSPTLGRSIAMALVDVDAVIMGSSVEVDVRGKREVAHVVTLPFYSRPRTRCGDE